MPFVQLEDALIAWAKEYGQYCRDAALEEAAQSLLEAGFRSTGIPAYESLAERVKGLK
jgi:hypothetical protein